MMLFNPFNKAKTTQAYESTPPEPSPDDFAPPLGITPPLSS
ncbi:MAG: hypothetical protein NVS2B12_42710 [Ktedonobacteraceae bacterium]